MTDGGRGSVQLRRRGKGEERKERNLLARLGAVVTSAEGRELLEVGTRLGGGEELRDGSDARRVRVGVDCCEPVHRQLQLDEIG